jgi:hypothetical protein
MYAHHILTMYPISRQLQLVGGVNLLLHPSTSAMFAAAGMLALDGRCKTLDATVSTYSGFEIRLTKFKVKGLGSKLS